MPNLAIQNPPLLPGFQVAAPDPEHDQIMAVMRFVRAHFSNQGRREGNVSVSLSNSTV